MSASSRDIEARLRELVPNFGAQQGSRTLSELANRNNLSNDAIRVYAAAGKQQAAQQRELAKLQAEAIRRQQEQDEFNANVQREAQAQYETALSSIGDERTQTVLAENGTLSSQVNQRLQAQYQNLQATGEHIDKQGNLTFQAASLQGALGFAGQQSAQDLQNRFGGDETARQVATTQAQRSLETGPVANFALSSAAAATRGIAGLPLQAAAAIGGDTAFGRGAGELATGVERFASGIDVVTPEEQQFRDEFAATEGFGGALSQIVRNPGSALQSFGPDVAGALAGGGVIGAGVRGAARVAAPALAQRAATGFASRQAGRTGSRLGRAANNFESGTLATAPAVFAGGAGDFTRGAEQALNSETDDIGSFAQRGLATSAVGALAGGAVSAGGLSTLDAPLLRARQAAAQPLPDVGRLGRVGRFGRVAGGELGRGAAGEGIQEGIEGAAQSISTQIGEGASLAELDGARIRRESGQGAAAGFALGGTVSGVTGTATTLRRRNEEQLRAQMQEATGQAGTTGVELPRDSLDSLSDGRIRGVIEDMKSGDTQKRIDIVLGVASDLGINSADISPQQVDSLLNQSVNAEELVDPQLLRSNIGNLLGVDITVDETGKAIRAPEPAADPAQAATQPPVGDVVEDQLDLNLDPAPAAEQAPLGSGPDTTLDPLADSNDALSNAADTDLLTEQAQEPLPNEPAPPTETAPENNDQQIQDPAAGRVGSLNDPILDNEIEATFGDVPNVASAIRDNDGSPRGQAAVDFQNALVRNQIARGLRQPGDTAPSAQLEITSRLEAAATEQGIVDPAERAEYFRSNRERVAEEFRLFREGEIEQRAALLPPTEPAAPSTDPAINPTPPAEPSTDLSQREGGFPREAGELNVITNDADPNSAILPQALRTAVLGAAPKATERRGVSDLSATERQALRDQYLKADDLVNPDTFGAARTLLDGIRKKIGSVYKVSATDLRGGNGTVSLKQKGTDASRAAAVAKLQDDIATDLQAVQTLMTPEGFQRVFGKKF